MWFLLQKYLRRAQQGHFLTTLQKHQSYIIAVFQFICIILIIIGLHRSNTIGYNFGCCSSHYSTLGHSPSIIYSLLYSISLEQMVSFEKYRKSYFCPTLDATQASQSKNSATTWHRCIDSQQKNGSNTSLKHRGPNWTPSPRGNPHLVWRSNTLCSHKENQKRAQQGHFLTTLQTHQSLSSSVKTWQALTVGTSPFQTPGISAQTLANFLPMFTKPKSGGSAILTRTTLNLL